MHPTVVCLLLIYGFFGFVATHEELPQNITLEMFMKMLESSKKPPVVDYNPDVDLTTMGMIRKEGYPAEAHVIPTEDGYLLTLHRIPGDKDSQPIFLQHGLLGSSADWVISGKSKGLAYILADKGYDVWMGNFRGNTYSKAHCSLSPLSSKFWEFSFHEMGIYDLPAAISYITNVRFQPIHMYIGHSMGTTTFYIMASKCPQITQMVEAMISLAPVAFVQHIKSPVRILAPFSKQYEIIANFLGYDEFMPQSNFVRLLSKYVCDLNIVEKKICSNIIFLFCGFDQQQFNYVSNSVRAHGDSIIRTSQKCFDSLSSHHSMHCFTPRQNFIMPILQTLLPSILSHSPAGTSTKTIVHFSQGISTGKFRPYDYGSKKNKQIYNATEPPDYDLTNITVPIALFYADNDWLVSNQDLKKLHGMLNNVLDVYRVPFTKFNHVDFLWGKDAPQLVYKRLLHLINQSYFDD